MQVLIRGDKIQVTDAMKEYVEEKLKKLDKYIDNSENIQATVVVRIRNYDQKVEITIPVKSLILRAEETRNDFYAAIDIVVEKLERQIRKNKTRVEAKYLKDNKTFIYEDFEEEEEEEDIIKRKKIEVKPMDEEEAIIQMELLGHQFYLYKDAVTNTPNVVYKRKDGGYGIIESE